VRDAAPARRACPLRTLTAPLALPSRENRAPDDLRRGGIYDRATGEQFPLVVRGDVTIAGRRLGQDAGRRHRPIDHNGGRRRARWTAGGDMLIGGHARPVAIRDSGLPPASAAVAEKGVFGVLCDRGTMAAFEGAPAAANTR